MRTIIFPGYSPSNRDWAFGVAERLKVDHEIRPVLWEHWSDESKKFDPKEKVQKLKSIVEKDDFNLITKSIGTLVAVMAIQSFPGQVQKVILCGIPNGVFDKYKGEYVKALTDFPKENLIVFQNESDPYGKYQETKNELNEINPKIIVVSKPRSDHDYPYYEEFNKFLEK